MKVYVKLFANLTQSVSDKVLAQTAQPVRAGSALEIELPDGSTVSDLVAYLELPGDQVKVIFVNGRAREPDYRLSAKDQVGIFPPIGGG